MSSAHPSETDGKSEMRAEYWAYAASIQAANLLASAACAGRITGFSVVKLLRPSDLFWVQELIARKVGMLKQTLAASQNTSQFGLNPDLRRWMCERRLGGRSRSSLRSSTGRVNEHTSQSCRRFRYLRLRVETVIRLSFSDDLAKIPLRGRGIHAEAPEPRQDTHEFPRRQWRDGESHQRF